MNEEVKKGDAATEPSPVALNMPIGKLEIGHKRTLIDLLQMLTPKEIEYFVSEARVNAANRQGMTVSVNGYIVKLWAWRSIEEGRVEYIEEKFEVSEEDFKRSADRGLSFPVYIKAMVKKSCDDLFRKTDSAFMGHRNWMSGLVAEVKR